MKILALEFSSPQRSVAVLDGGAHHASLALAEIIETDVGGTHALSMIDEALRQSRIEREQIECLAIGLGPGSYTGIRSAIALAQGWQLARDAKLVGISSADGIAAQAQSEGARGAANVAIDAQRNEFYLARYELGTDDWRIVEALRLATREQVRERGAGDELLCGPEVERWFPNGKTVFPRAATLARLALARPDFIAGEQLEPIYLRETKFVKAPPPRRAG